MGEQFVLVLVTKDPQLIALTKKTVGEELGPEIEVYGDSVEALNAFYINPWRGDLCVLDTDMDGLLIAEQLLKTRPSKDIILVVPDRDQLLLAEAATIGIKLVFTKPLLAERPSFLADIVASKYLSP